MRVTMALAIAGPSLQREQSAKQHDNDQVSPKLEVNHYIQS